MQVAPFSMSAGSLSLCHAVLDGAYRQSRKFSTRRSKNWDLELRMADIAAERHGLSHHMFDYFSRQSKQILADFFFIIFAKENGGGMTKILLSKLNIFIEKI